MQALALIFLKLNAQAFEIDLVFFGFWCVLIGYLIFRSTFLPRILGVLLAIDGLGWMTYMLPANRKPAVPLHRCRLRPRGNTAAAMARRDGCKSSTMEGADRVTPFS